MADFLVIIAIVVFVAAMLGLICGGETPGDRCPPSRIAPYQKKETN